LAIQIAKIERCIAKLKPMEQKIITMRYFDCAEIAHMSKMLYLNRSTVYRRMAKIYKTLQFLCVSTY